MIHSTVSDCDRGVNDIVFIKPVGDILLCLFCGHKQNLY